MAEKIGTIFTYQAELPTDENDPRIRNTLMKVSINSFLEHPFFGVGLYEPGKMVKMLLGCILVLWIALLNMDCSEACGTLVLSSLRFVD